MTRAEHGPADLLPLREGLRALRFLTLRARVAVGEAVGETAPSAVLPAAASRFATQALHGADRLAQDVDSLASQAAKAVLGGPARPARSLDRIIDCDDPAGEFARTVYPALKTVLHRLGADDLFVSEASARRTFHAWLRQGQAAGKGERLASLTLDLHGSTTLCGTGPSGASRDLRALAVFAVLLWLDSPRSEAEDASALDSAAAITQAKAAEIAPAIRSGDRQSLAVLFQRLSSHV